MGDEVVEVTVRRRREIERADGTIELGAAAVAAPPSRFHRRCGLYPNC